MKVYLCVYVYVYAFMYVFVFVYIYVLWHDSMGENGKAKRLVEEESHWENGKVIRVESSRIS